MALSADKSGGTTIYAALAEKLREKIRAGHLAPGDLIGSEHELSRQENISRMTVRKASDLLIQEGLLERRPGKGLYVAGSPTLANSIVQIVAGNLMWETAMQLARGVQQSASTYGIHVQLYDAHGDVDLDLQVIDQLPTTKIKGAVIISLHNPRFSAAICRLHASGFPFVLLDQRMRDIEVSAVTADNYGGGAAMGQHFVAKGHRQVAFIGDLIAVTVQERLAGFRDALAEAGVPLRRAMIRDLTAGIERFGDWSSNIRETTEQLMAAPDRPTAIFCSCDAIAVQVYKTLEMLGLNVSADVSVAGFDDDPLDAYLKPALTTVRQPFMEMGTAAMQLLRERIDRPTNPPQFHALPVTLVERDSIRQL